MKLAKKKLEELYNQKKVDEEVQLETLQKKRTSLNPVLKTKMSSHWNKLVKHVSILRFKSMLTAKRQFKRDTKIDIK